MNTLENMNAIYRQFTEKHSHYHVQLSSKTLYNNFDEYLLSYIHKLRDNIDEHVTQFYLPDHDDVIKWKHFPRYWPFVWEIRRSPVNSPHTGQWRGALFFFFDLPQNKLLNKQSWNWWFETPSRPLWRHCDGHQFRVITVGAVNSKFSSAFSISLVANWRLWDISIVTHKEMMTIIPSILLSSQTPPLIWWFYNIVKYLKIHARKCENNAMIRFVNKHIIFVIST